MTAAHQILAVLVAGATVALVVAGGWSIVSARRTAGESDHRFAVDRLVLLLVALIAANGLIGLALVGSGAHPADPLHLLYGAAALVTLPVGAWLGRRGGIRAGSTRPGRPRRGDAWLMGAAILLLGLELRLVMTG